MKIKLLKSMMLLGAMLSFGFIQAQDVSGTVIDNNGVPLPGANIIVKGTSNGAQSDFDGLYSLSNVASDAILVFSYVGYDTQEIPVNGQTTVNVTLLEGNVLNEIVVIGYGTTTVKDATGAVASVSSEDFNAGVISSPEQLIQGKTAGVQISQTSGEPGAGIDIRIRGTNSVRSDNNPLFVVDGIPLAGQATSAGNDVAGVGVNPAKNPLSFLNPNDIASISILKDASATAIYGSRGSNGVVIITTKTGRSGRGEFQYDSNISISNPSETFDLLTAEQYLAESTANGFDASVRNAGSDTSWQNVIYRGSVSTNQSLSYSKNYGGGNYRATFGYSNQNGIVETSGLERITGRLNATHRLFDDKLKIEFQGTISRVNDDTPPLAGTAGFRGDLIGAAYAANPTWPNDPDFGSNGELGGLINPANLLAYTQNESNTNRYLLGLAGSYKITDELTAKLSGAYDYSDSDTRAVSSKDLISLDGVSGNGRGTYFDFEFENTLMEATLNYKKDFGDSSLDVLGGFSYQKFDRNGVTVQGWGFGTSDLAQMGRDLKSTYQSLDGQIPGSYQQFGYGTALQTNEPVTGNVFVNRIVDQDLQLDFLNLQTGALRALTASRFDNFDELQSYFARVNYTLQDKYLFTGTVRADGSTKFGEDEKYGYFPSGAIAWKINEEDFIGDKISTLKLRVNAGLTGNQEGIPYGSAVRRTEYGGLGISNSGEIGIPIGQFVAYENVNLKWETTFQFGAGIDFGLNNERLTASLDVYRKETQDLLFNILEAQPARNPFRFVNLPDSEVVNSGVEFVIGYDFVQTENLTWNMSVNAAYNDNIVESLSGEYISGAINGQGLSNAFSQNLKEGYPLYSWYLREFEGFDSNGNAIIGGDGDPVFVDKSALPTVTGGLSTSLNYKNWNMNAYFNGAWGHYLYNATKNAFFTAGSFASARNVLVETLQTEESLNASADPSTRFLEKGDFVRLQNLSVSYNMPLKGEGLFKSVILSATGQNIFVITDYTGLDPEVSSRTDNGLPTSGIDYGAYPNPRTFTFGINAKF